LLISSFPIGLCIIATIFIKRNAIDDKDWRKDKLLGKEQNQEYKELSRTWCFDEALNFHSIADV